MFQHTPHQSHADAEPVAVLVMAIVLVLLLALSLPALAQVGAPPADQPLHAPAGLGL